MNPLTQVKNTQKITAREAALGISDAGSWHATYKNSAYIYVGGLSFQLTEGDLLAVFAQYGEIVDINLVRDKATGKPRGFAFLAYEDQRSTVLAVDNLNGATVIGRILKVEHVSNYKRKLEEDEEEEQRKREERGVCYAFQRGECSRGSACKFSHDEKRNADTGWGSKDNEPRWGHDKYDGTNIQHAKKRDEDGKKRDALGRSREERRETNERSRNARREDILNIGNYMDNAERHRYEKVDTGKFHHDTDDDDNETQKDRLGYQRRHHAKIRDNGEEAQNFSKSVKTYSQRSDIKHHRGYEDHHKRTGEFKRPGDSTDIRDERRERQVEKESKKSRR